MNIYNNTFTQNQQQSYITCYIEESKIIRVDQYGNKEVVGIEKDVYNALFDEREQFYNRLVELGDIVPPKTQEEINAELMEQLKASQEAQKEMLAIIQSMKKEEKNNAKSKPNNQGSGNTSINVPKSSDK